MVYIIGAGPGDSGLLTSRAKEIIRSCDMCLSTLRISDGISELNSNIRILNINEIVDFLNSFDAGESDTAVIATGDVGFYSIASTLKKRLKSDIKLEFISGISSVQYLTSKLMTGYEDIKLVSLHGKNKSIVPYVCYNKRIFCLTGGENSVSKIINDLISRGLSDVIVTVGERLSYPDEKITVKKAGELKGTEFDKLSVMLIENDACADPYSHLCDGDFIRGKAPMTKQPVRDLSVELMNVRPEDTVYDIGAGTGSVTVCLAKRAREGFVYAFEKEQDAVCLIYQNIQKFGTKNIITIEGKAPLENDDIPAPDKVFIGGSGGNLSEILSWVLAKNKNAEFVVNALTIETITETVESFKKLNFCYEMICVNASVSEKLGRYTMMKAQNPIYIIKGAAKE